MRREPKRRHRVEGLDGRERWITTRGHKLAYRWGPWAKRYPANARLARVGARIEINAFGQVDLSGHLGRHGLHLGYMPRRKFTWRDAAARRRLQAVRRLQDAERALADAQGSDDDHRALVRVIDARIDSARVDADIDRHEVQMLRPRFLRVYPRRLAPAA